MNLISSAVIALWFATWAGKPTPDHAAIADVIVAVSVTQDEERELAAIAVLESGVRVNPCTSGPCDGRRSHGWAQIYNGPASLDHDAMQTGLRAVAILRQSKALCPAFPFAVYARGTFGCSSIEAQRISRMREKLARSFVVPGDADD